MMKRGHDVESAPNIWRRRTAMEHYAGIDVSLELSSVCVVDAQGKIVREVKVGSEPEALVALFASLGFAMKRIGLEAGPLSQWLHAGLKRAGFDTVLLETTTREGGVIGNDGEDRPQGCARACPADPDGLVPSGARQVDGLARGAGIVGCAQAASRAAYRRRIEHSRNPARLWPEGRAGD